MLAAHLLGVDQTVVYKSPLSQAIARIAGSSFARRFAYEVDIEIVGPRCIVIDMAPVFDDLDVLELAQEISRKANHELKISDVGTRRIDTNIGQVRIVIVAGTDEGGYVGEISARERAETG